MSLSPSESPSGDLSNRRISTERERKPFHARIEKFDLELAVRDRLRLPDQLIHPQFRGCAAALVVDVNSVSSARRLTIEEHAKSNRSSARCRSHDEMQVTRVKTVRDPPFGLVQHNGLLPQRPIPRKGPTVEAQPRGNGIDARLVPGTPARRHKVLGALIADIVFPTPQATPIGRHFGAMRSAERRVLEE